MEDIGKLLNNFFARFQSCNDTITTFYCSLSLIKVYFNLNTYRNSRMLQGWVKRSELDVSRDLPFPVATTYYYYCGRLNLYELNLEDSKKNFEEAFKLMKRHEVLVIEWKNNTTQIAQNRHFKNKKVLLEYLIIINLFYGQTPSKTFLKRYNLFEFYGEIKRRC